MPIKKQKHTSSEPAAMRDLELWGGQLSHQLREEMQEIKQEIVEKMDERFEKQDEKMKEYMEQRFIQQDEEIKNHMKVLVEDVVSQFKGADQAQLTLHRHQIAALDERVTTVEAKV